ncbi:MAG: hypothetical protein AB7P04_04645 [Bacteriovoracia bacterium]
MPPIVPPSSGSPPAGARMHMRETTPEQRAARAEQDANQRIMQSQQVIRQTEEQEQAQVDQLRDRYSTDRDVESAKQEEALQKQKDEGYERLRELKRAQAAELARTKQTGEKANADLQRFYSDEIDRNASAGEKQLRETTGKNANTLAAEEKKANQDIELVKSAGLMKVADTHDLHEQRVQKLKSATDSEYEKMRLTYGQANARAYNTHKGHYAQSIAKNQEVLQDVNARAAEKIREIRQDTSDKLSAYGRRQSDPFYRLVDLDADLTSDADAYTLKANIPSHEQGHVSVSVRGNQLVLTGLRRNEERLEVGPGEVKTTTAFQSYSQTFPLEDAVAPKLLSKRFEGDQLIVTLPKHGRAPAPIHKKDVGRVRAEQPKFPGNLPVAETRPSERERVAQGEEPANESGIHLPALPYPGSKPLEPA